MIETTLSPDTPKAQALASAAAFIPEATGLVEYQSEGRLLIIGSTEQITQVLPDLADELSIRCLLTQHSDSPPDKLPFDVISAGSIQIDGYLGQFEVTSDAGQRRCDSILDLTEPSVLTMPLKPNGYFAPGAERARWHEAAQSVSDLIGRFEKPQFFDYKANICAHSASELEGCTRCVDACPADAIISIGDQIEVNPHLCQGGGICTSVCPTGAISYRYPGAGDTLDRLRRMLRAYHGAGGDRACLVLHAEAELPDGLSHDEIPLALEEIASVGLEIWLAALAFGARSIKLYRDKLVPPSVVQLLDAQRGIANAILDGLGFAPAVRWLDDKSPNPGLPTIAHATFGSNGGKRDALFQALDHLSEQAKHCPTEIALPAGAPIGAIQVQSSGCTLCMSCVSVCPAKALADGDGEPALRFHEINCVQCGLCETACPENVISLVPRLLTHAKARRDARVLHSEQPFNCVRCNTPFATHSVISRMTEKLAGHHMFQDPSALNRLKMCADCRVLDMMEHQT